MPNLPSFLPLHGSTVPQIFATPVKAHSQPFVTVATGPGRSFTAILRELEAHRLQVRLLESMLVDMCQDNYYQVYGQLSTKHCANITHCSL